MDDGDYVLGRSAAESERLGAQGALFAEATSHLYRRAGIGVGMRVLVVGCGTGEDALLVADLVGPTGHVIAVDHDPGVVEVARRRAAAAGAAHVEVQIATLPDVELDGPVDAVAGRLVLLHLPDPPAAVRALARHLGPASTLVNMLPLAERLGVATAAEVGPETLAERLAEAVSQVGADIYLPPMIGTWAEVGDAAD